jgi:hypothetical protein
MQEEFKNTNGVIRTHNYQRTDNTMTNKKKEKRTNKDLQNTTNKSSSSYYFSLQGSPSLKFRSLIGCETLCRN